MKTVRGRVLWYFRPLDFPSIKSINWVTDSQGKKVSANGLHFIELSVLNYVRCVLLNVKSKSWTPGIQYSTTDPFKTWTAGVQDLNVQQYKMFDIIFFSSKNPKVSCEDYISHFYTLKKLNMYPYRRDSQDFRLSTSGISIKCTSFSALDYHRQKTFFDLVLLTIFKLNGKTSTVPVHRILRLQGKSDSGVTNTEQSKTQRWL